VSTAERAEPVTAAEADVLFAGLEDARGVVLAISGGPDSTALLWLIAQWRRARGSGPPILAATVDHGLRPEAREEAAAVGRIAKRCGIAHRTLRWVEAKPKTGLQQAAREARYRLLAGAAARIGADRILTAHTQDDQAETLLMRMSRGSGIAGLGGMAREAPVPGNDRADVMLLRPFLPVPKARLVATLRAAGVEFADDPSNRDSRFARARLRALMPALAEEGLDAARLAQLAARLRRAEAAIAATADRTWNSHAQVHAGNTDGVRFDPAVLRLPAEILLRVLGRAIGQVGNEGPVELAKLESLHDALAAAAASKSRLRRTLAGAVVTFDGRELTVAQAPLRRAHLSVRRRRPGEPVVPANRLTTE
jgi:tRNA(Ile)-lysidine synthase